MYKDSELNFILMKMYLSHVRTGSPIPESFLYLGEMFTIKVCRANNIVGNPISMLSAFNQETEAYQSQITFWDRQWKYKSRS